MVVGFDPAPPSSSICIFDEAKEYHARVNKSQPGENNVNGS